MFQIPNTTTPFWKKIRVIFVYGLVIYWH